jgi:hypothetical protein
MNDPWFKNNSHLKIGNGAIIFNGMSGRYGLQAMSLFCGLIMIFYFIFLLYLCDWTSKFGPRVKGPNSIYSILGMSFQFDHGFRLLAFFLPNWTLMILC